MRLDDLYRDLRASLARERLPCALVRLDAFDRNLARMVAPLEGAGRTLRIATKSVRVPALLERALAHGSGLCRGLMCFSAAEALWLAGSGFDDLLIAYPTVQQQDVDAVAELAARGAVVRQVVDCAAHLEALAAAARRRGTVCDVVVELDLSLRPFAGLAHLGTRRSPVRSAAQALSLCRRAEGLEGVRACGLMAYEAHVAGLPDAAPVRGLTAPLARMLKRIAMPRAQALRARVVAALRADGIRLEIVNGGGTGTLAQAAAEETLTEVSAGSGLFGPHLFDAYAGLSLEPAAAFALQVVRAPDPGWVTCHGGGYVASGQAGADRLPRPWLPGGLRLHPLEGAGEVQTPLRTSGCRVPLAPGDPVLFRHAKAGELMEHFGEVLLLDAVRGRERVPTYRGAGLQLP
jgi:D-serine deaminase-like pyridoxal phosphate-dependent protein